MTLVVTYVPEALEDADDPARRLYLAYRDENAWVPLESSQVDPETNQVTATVD